MVIFKFDIMLDIMDSFFQWLMLNEYITYKVMLNEHFIKMETKA